jgi:hypothetical protein
MRSSDLFAVLAIIGALVFQIWVTLRVRRSELYEGSEKAAQTRLIWMVPVFGALIAFGMLGHDEPQTKNPSDDRSMRS